MVNTFLYKATKRISAGVLLLLTTFLFFSCSKKTNRVYLDYWQYSLDDISYSQLDNKDLGELERLVPDKKGYIYIKTRFMIPENLKLNSYGICIGRVNLASEIFFDNHEIAETGSFPPKKFSNGHKYTFALLPVDMVRLGDVNEVKLKIYIEGSGGLHGRSFVSEYKDASNSVAIHNFIHSTLILLVAAFMLFTGIVYLIMFFKMQNDPTMIFFSLMSFSTIFFLLPSFIGSFPWILGFMNYDWFLKIFQGCFAMITAFLAVCFSSHYMGLREPFYFLCLRIGILVIGIIYCLLIPDTLHFYNMNFVTVLMIAIQVLPFIPSVIIGLKMRAKIMGMMMAGNSAPVDQSNLPKGIPVGATIQLTETEEEPVEGPQLPPQGVMQSESESVPPSNEQPAESPQVESGTNAETPPEQDDAQEHDKPTDDNSAEEPPKVISRYGVPPPAVRKMLEERAASFEKKSKNPLLPKFIRKAMEEKVTYFMEMSTGMREPPEFMARMMGAPVGGPPGVGTPPQGSKPPVAGATKPPVGVNPPQGAKSPMGEAVLKPVKPPVGVNLPQGAKPPIGAPIAGAVKPSISMSPQNAGGLPIGKANPPPFVSKMMDKGGQIQMGGTAIPLAGELDDISMAQLKYTENTIGTLRQLITGYMPTFIAIVLDIIFRFILKMNNLPYITLFGWECTTIMFLFMLITNFSKIKKRGEDLSKNLREIVFKSTEELKQKAEELEKQNKQSQKDLEMAAQVQKTFYPTGANFYGWDMAVDFRPLSNVSGDLYDFYEMEGNLRGFGIFDVSGHGISASLVTMLAKNSIFRAFRSSLSIGLSEAILRINDEIIRAKGNIENYLTGALFRIDRDDPSKIEMVNAGSPYPILKPANEKAKFLKPAVDDTKVQHGMLGISGLDVAFCTIPFELKDNDTLILYTDGLTEAENKDGEQYGKERLLNLISEIHDESDSATILEKIRADFNAFVGSQPLDDDITVLVVRRTEEVAVIEAEDDEGVLEDLEDYEI